MARLAALTTLIAAAATAVTAQTPANLPQFSGYTYSGSGCPVSSNGVVTHSGGDYTAERWNINGFTSNSTSNCEIHLSAGGATEGWQVALDHVKLTGKTSLTSGSSLTYYVDYFWSNDASDTIGAQGTINGQCTDEAFSVTLQIETLLWSQCIGSDGNPGILNVDVRGAIDGTGSFEFDSEEWDFAWRKC